MLLQKQVSFQKQQDCQTVLASSFETVALVCFADATFLTGREGSSKHHESESFDSYSSAWVELAESENCLNPRITRQMVERMDR